MISLVLLACTGEAEDSAAAGPVTSDERAEISGAVVSQCVDDELKLQIGFTGEVPKVEANLTTDNTSHEIHEIPFGGMDKSTGTIFIYEATLATGASEAESGTSTTFTCDQGPVAAFYMYDSEGAIMGCYIGEFVVDYYDSTGCPE